MIALSALRGHWFPVCRSAELRGAPVQRTLLGEPLALFRNASGRPAALADRCPHRNAPLSAGQVHAGRIACPYHGWQFDGEGVCRAVPGLRGAPEHPTRAVASFPAIELDGLVWVALEPPVAPPAPMPREPGAALLTHAFALEAQLLDGLENFLDPTHTHFVHAGVVRGERPRRLVTALLRGGPDRVEAEYIGEGQQSGLVSRLFGAGVERSLGRFVLPATVELEYRTARRTALLIRLIFTPESEGSLRVFALATGRTAPLPPWLVAAPLGLLLGLVVRQDKAILALQRRNVRRFGGERFSSTELDLMRPHILRLFRAAEHGPPAPFERRVQLWL